jgi:hypothetical protein
MNDNDRRREQREPLLADLIVRGIMMIVLALMSAPIILFIDGSGSGH